MANESAYEDRKRRLLSLKRMRRLFAADGHFIRHCLCVPNETNETPAIAGYFLSSLSNFRNSFR
jgi:hypothetical protein